MMRGYQSPYERSRSLRAVVKPLLVIGVILIVLVFGAMWLIDYILGQQIVVTGDSFNALAVKNMAEHYQLETVDGLTPMYTFEQGDEESRTHYTGIVLRIDADISAVLEQCFGMHPDGEEYLNHYNDFQDYFVDDSYHGDTETIVTDAGRQKAIRMGVSGEDFVYYFFEVNGTQYLMARRDA